MILSASDASRTLQEQQVPVAGPSTAPDASSQSGSHQVMLSSQAYQVTSVASLYSAPNLYSTVRFTLNQINNLAGPSSALNASHNRSRFEVKPVASTSVGINSNGADSLTQRPIEDTTRPSANSSLASNRDQNLSVAGL